MYAPGLVVYYQIYDISLFAFDLWAVYYDYHYRPRPYWDIFWPAAKCLVYNC